MRIAAAVTELVCGAACGTPAETGGLEGVEVG